MTVRPGPPRPEEDAGDTTPPPAQGDVTGTWHDCTTTIIYGADGTTTAINHREGGCTARGTYVVEGDLEPKRSPVVPGHQIIGLSIATEIARETKMQVMFIATSNNAY